MKPAPLQLRKLVFPRVNIEVLESGTGELGISNEVLVEAGTNPGNPRHFGVKMTLRFGQMPGQKKVYVGEVQAYGDFLVADDWPQEEARKLVVVNGSSMVYGAIREMVYNVTARGPWYPALWLSSLSFADGADNISGSAQNNPDHSSVSPQSGVITPTWRRDHKTPDGSHPSTKSQTPARKARRRESKK